MAIARQGSATVGTSLGTGSTPSYTANAASNLVVCSIASAKQVTALTYGGTSMTFTSIENTTDATWVTLGYLLSPATGAHNFAPTTISGSFDIYAADYSGVGAADGSSVTNGATNTATLTTNVALANANEWVMCAAASNQPFSSTANLTIAQSSTTFIASALYDSNAGVGSGTIGFVTTVTGSFPRQWVVMQAFTAAAASGTTITANFGVPSEFLATINQNFIEFFEASAGLQQDSSGLLEVTASLQRDSAPHLDWEVALASSSNTPLESLNSFITNSSDQIEFLLRVNNNSQIFQETLAAQVVGNSIDIESLNANSLNIEAPIEIKSSLIQIVSNESTPIESTTAFNINTVLPLEVISTNKLVLSNTSTLMESLGSITANTLYQDEWLASQVSQLSGIGEWLLAVKLNSSILEAWQSVLLHNSTIQVEFVGSIIADTSVPLEYVGTTKLVVGNSTLPVEFSISISGGQAALDELTQILSQIIPLEDEFAGTPITILLSSIGRLARSVKIRLSESTTKVRLLGPKVRSPR